MINEMIKIFEQANAEFLSKHIRLIESGVSERALCGALMLHMNNEIKNTEYNRYYVDVEYNRNKGGTIKTCVKTIQGPKEEVIRINCDLIVHSRGEIVSQDNLIALEMKKSTRPEEEKEKDRIRLCALTKDSFNDVWSFDGKTLPEHVCRYVLGVYYEINIDEECIDIEYYRKGYCCQSYSMPLKNNFR